MVITMASYALQSHLEWRTQSRLGLYKDLTTPDAARAAGQCYFLTSMEDEISSLERELTPVMTLLVLLLLLLRSVSIFPPNCNHS